MIIKKKILIILGILLIVTISFSAGIFVAKLNEVSSDLSISKTESQTFYATIEKIRENRSILVKGLEINDINYRGEFYLSIGNNTIITWRGQDISISDLHIGDNISVTFTDEIINAIHPATLNQITKIQLLDDKQ